MCHSMKLQCIHSEGASLADEEECVLCSTELSPRDRFVVPCCSLHLTLFRKWNQMPQQILGRRVEFHQRIPDLIHQPVVPPPPRSIWLVCCRRVGGSPDCVFLEDQRMDWSPVQVGASGGSWTFQWVCLVCSRTFWVEDVPPLPDSSCLRCQFSGVVLDMATGDVRRVCISCNCLVIVPDPPEEDWFSSGPLCGLYPLYTHSQQT